MSASAPASAAQLTELMKLFCGLSGKKIQQLLDNHKLFLWLANCGHLDTVNHEAFRALLEHDPLDVYSELLKTPEEGLAILRSLNDQCWGGYFSAEQFSQAEDQLKAIPDGFQQHVRDVRFFHPTFSSPEKTADKLLIPLLIKAPSLKFGDELHSDWRYSQTHELGGEYPPDSISLVRADLAAHWKGQGTIAAIRDQAKLAGENLAHLELLSLFGVCPELMLKQDGENLPYFVMAGLERRPKGVLDDGERYSLRFCQGKKFGWGGKLELGWEHHSLMYSNRYGGECSAPTITRCQD